MPTWIGSGLKWIESQKIDKSIIYVLGNHEYYHHEIGLIDEIKANAPDNIYVLDEDSVEIDDVRFIRGSSDASVK